MVHSNNFVVVVQVAGGILREDRAPDGTNRVHIPFGTDYSLKFKNMDSRRACVTVSIDGKDVMDDDGLVIEGNSSSELMGFIERGRVKHAFRFTKKTQEIVDHRGDQLDDGIIRIAWRYEVPVVKERRITEVVHEVRRVYPPYRPFGPQWDMTYCCTTGASSTSEIKTRGEPIMATCHNMIPETKTRSFADFGTAPAEEEGITVKGADRSQEFRTISVGTLEEIEHVVCIKLVGWTRESGKAVERPILTRKDLVCDVCGRKSRSDSKFCPGCGNALR